MQLLIFISYNDLPFVEIVNSEINLIFHFKNLNYMYSLAFVSHSGEQTKLPNF